MPDEPLLVSPPWSTLGGYVNEKDSVGDMLKKHGLNWKVNINQLSYQDRSGELRQLKSHRLLVRSDTDSPLGICGPQYVPIQNNVAFNFFKLYCDSAKMNMTAIGCFGKGTMPWALADIGEGFTLPGKDRVGGYVLLFNPHIWGHSFTVKYTSIRVVCMNTLVEALREDAGVKKFKFPHIREFDEAAIKSAKEVLEAGRHQLLAFKQEAEVLANAKIDDGTAVKYMAWAFDEPVIKDAMGSDYKDNAKTARFLAKDKKFKVSAMDLTKRGSVQALGAATKSPGAELESAVNTLWGQFNGVTFYVDHLAGSDKDRALSEAWVGTKAGLKLKALNKARALAEAL